MEARNLTCDRKLLRQLLSDSLSEERESQLADHLSECATCQRELECMAADGFELSRIREPLRGQAQPSPDSSAQARVDLGINEHSSGDGLLNFEADFAVDFLDPSTTPQLLGRLGGIEIHEVIGRGGMGIVLRGFQHELNRLVAVKVLAPHLATSGAARKRFAREAQAAAAIVHPNVMPILTVDSSSKLPYLVMPYIGCESLQQRLDRGGPLETVDVLRIAVQIASGLTAAHAQGLVHRDVKPANVLLEKGVDRAMLTDFGLARAVDDATLTRSGVIAGTPQYMSPEQARGEGIDQRSDLFSLGSVMYAMCTGRPPYRAESSYGILRRITDAEPRSIREINSEIPDWLCLIIAKLMSKQPDERFGSAREITKLLEECLAHVQQPTAVPLPNGCHSLHEGSATPAQREPTRLRRSIGVTTMIALVGCALLGLFLWQSGDPSGMAGREPAERRPSAATRLSHLQPMFRIYPEGRVKVLAYSPDGKALAVGGDRSMAILYDAKTGKRITTLELFSEEEEAILANARFLEVVELAFSPDSSVLAVGHSLGQVKLFDARTGKFKLSLDDVAGRAETGKALHGFPELRRAHGGVLGIAFSPDGRLLATCGSAIDDNRDGEPLRAGPDFGILKLWDAKSGELKQDLKGEHNSWVFDVAFSPDGSLLASAGNVSADAPPDTGVRLWDPGTGTVTKSVEIPRGDLEEASPVCLGMSADGKRMVIGTWRHDTSTRVKSGSINVVHLTSGVLDRSWGVPRQVRPVAFSRDGTAIAALSDTNVLTLWDSATGQEMRELRPTENSERERWGYFAFSPTDDVLAISGRDAKKRNFVEVWESPSTLSECDAHPQSANARRLAAITDAHHEVESALGVLKVSDDTSRRFDAVWDIRKGFNRFRQYNDSGAAYVEPLTSLLGDKKWRVRLLVCDMLGQVGIGNAQAEKHLAETLSDGDERVRFQAALALVRIGAPKPQCESILRKGLENGLEPVRRDAAWALVRIGELER